MKFLRILTNKYLLTTAAFVVLMLFFDQNDWVSQQHRKHDLQNVEQNITFLKGEIARMDKDYTALISDTKTLERFAREHYRMKRDSEDLYIVEGK